MLLYYPQNKKFINQNHSFMILYKNTLKKMWKIFLFTPLQTPKNRTELSNKRMILTRIKFDQQMKDILLV